MISTQVALIITVMLVVPGYVYHQFSRRFLWIPAPSDQASLLSYLTASLWSLAIAWAVAGAFRATPLAHMLVLLDQTRGEGLAAAAACVTCWVWQILVLPVILAMTTAFLGRKGWVPKVLKALHLEPLPRQPQPWACVFDQARNGPLLALVTLKDGNVVLGAIATSSVANVDVATHDVYLDRLYVADGKGGFNPEPDSRGMLISGAEIRTIQLAEITEGPSHGRSDDHP